MTGSTPTPGIYGEARTALSRGSLYVETTRADGTDSGDLFALLDAEELSRYQATA